MMINKRKLKICLYYFLEFMLFIFIFGFSLILLAKGTLLNASYIKNSLKNNNYYVKTTNLIIADSKDYLISSGLKDNVLDGVFLENVVMSDINGLIDSIFLNTQYEINTENIKNKLEENINNYLKEQNLKISNQSSLDTFVKEICNVYKMNITLNNLPNIVKSIYKYVFRYINVLFIGLGVGIIVIFFIIKFMYKKRSIIIIPLFAASFLYFFTYVYIVNKIDIANMTIFTDVFSLLMKDMLLKFLKYLNGIGLSMLLVAINLKIIKLRIYYLSE